jgi:hypothetical protein
MIIAEIAEHDYPEQWPDLVNILVQQFETCAPNDPMALGSLKCLSLVAEHFSDRQVGLLFPTLFPYVMNVTQSEKYPQLVRSKALSVAAELIELLGMMKMEFEEDALRTITPLVPEILKVIGPLISQPVRSAEADCSLQMIGLKVLLKLTKHFSKQISPHSKQILQVVVISLATEYDVYVLIFHF